MRSGATFSKWVVDAAAAAAADAASIRRPCKGVWHAVLPWETVAVCGAALVHCHSCGAPPELTVADCHA
jgi:hypothetical protein